MRHRGAESVIKIDVSNEKQRCLLWCARAEEKQRKGMRWCALWIEEVVELVRRLEGGLRVLVREAA